MKLLDEEKRIKSKNNKLDATEKSLLKEQKNEIEIVGKGIINYSF